MESRALIVCDVVLLLDNKSNKSKKLPTARCRLGSGVWLGVSCFANTKGTSPPDDIALEAASN